jgi:hypothetical protein
VPVSFSEAWQFRGETGALPAGGRIQITNGTNQIWEQKNESR